MISKIRESLLSAKNKIFHKSSSTVDGLFEKGSILGDGQQVSSERYASRFNQIKVDGLIDLDYCQSESPFLKITTDSNLHKYVKAEVYGGMLVISVDSKVSVGSPVVVECGSLELKRVESKGGSCIDLSDVYAPKRFTVVVEGDSDVYLSGQCRSFVGRVKGDGEVEASDFHSENADLVIKGDGKIKVNSRKKVRASINGGGRVLMSVRPKEIKERVKGSGFLRVEGE